MAKKGENIRKRKDGRWEGRILHMTTDGTKKMHSVYAKTYAEVKRKMSQETACMVEKRNETSPVSVTAVSEKNVIFGEAAQLWLREAMRTKKHSTYVKYKNIYQRYLEKELEEQKINTLTENGINKKIFCRKNSNTYSDSICKSIRCVLNSILRYAAEEYEIAVPQIPKVQAGKTNRKITILTYAEKKRLLCYFRSHMDTYALGILLCLTTGLRLGELCALKWKDIDLTGRSIHIVRTVQRIEIEGHSTKTILLETPPKSDCSIREIPLPDALIVFLEEAHEHVTSEDSYLLNGARPMEPRNYQYFWKNCLKKAGIEDKNFHCLRHTFATDCINSGADPKSLCEILGHSDVRITLNRYVHPTMEEKRSHVNKSFAYLFEKEEAAYSGQDKWSKEKTA